MAKFGIYSSLGVKKAEGYPTFTGTYMKPGVLDFREIGSPTPIEWEIGDYVGYESNGSVIPAYSRTGNKYTLYNIPQVKRQSSNGKYGGAFLYQNVQFHDATFDFEICPFRDLVTGDNRVHFSTQPAISVFDDVAGIGERIQACLDDMYPGKWVIRVASGTDYDTLMAEEREYAVSGVSIKGAFDKIYEVWPEVGWIYSYEQVNGAWKNVVTIGGAGLNVPGTYSYAKGNGLLSLSRTVANADQLANRLYVYGSNRNMLPKWYNNQDIKDADSVDIQHLMLPVGAIASMGYSGWGKTEVQGVQKPDPAKAYIEDSASISARGLRPKTVYFDGSGDYKEIYPTIGELTIGELRTVMESTAPYYPNPSIWTNDNERVDKVLSVNSTFDNGLAANNGKEAVQSTYANISASDTTTIPANTATKVTRPFYSHTFTPEETGRMNLNLLFDLSGTVVLPGIEEATMEVRVQKTDASGDTVFVKSIDLENSDSQPNTFLIESASFDGANIQITNDNLYVSVSIIVNPGTATSARTLAITGTGVLTFSLSRFRARTFSISLKQIGFDINEQANLGEGKTIAMRSGSCVGRSFRISSASYISSTDSWNLEVIRSNDESLSQWFPNSSYPIAAGDEFVLLDIAMPDIYVSVAEKRLLAAAQELLADTSKEQWQYTPDVDAKFMAENSRSINAGDIIEIADSDIVDDNGRLLVDSVTITEGESTIPTYKVTIRERKKKTYSDKASVIESKSTPVASATVVIPSGKDSTTKDRYFEEDGQGNIKLKDEYAGLWAAGFVSAGGMGSGGGSGTGGIDKQTLWKQLQNTDTETTIYNGYPIAAEHIFATTPGDIGLKLGSNLSYNPSTHTLSAVAVTSLAALTDVALGTLVNNDVLAYDTTLSKWKNLALGAAAFYGVGSVAQNNTGLVTGGAVWAAIDALPEPMVFKGSLGTGGTITSLPTASSANEGYTYKVITDGTYAGQTAKIGDLFISNGSTWIWIPSGDEPSGTVTSVGMSVPTGLSVSGSPITTSGTFAITFASGYSIPLTADTNKGVTAYGWGDHSQAGYLLASTASSTYATITALNGVSGRVSTLEARQNWDDIFAIDSNGNVYLKQYTEGGETKSRGFWTYSFVSAGGVGSGGGGGGGVGLVDVWNSMDNSQYSETYGNRKIHTNHLPTIVSGTGLVYTNTTTDNVLSTTVGLASGYIIPTVSSGSLISVSHLYNFWQSLQNSDIVTTYNSYKIHTNHLPSISYSGGVTGQWGVSGSGSSLATTLTLGVDASALTTSLSGNWLPLSAGAGSPLTGDLYLGSHVISGVTNIDSILYFDTINSRIGIGTNSPTRTIDVRSSEGIRFKTGSYASENYPSLGALGSGTFSIVDNYNSTNDFGLYIWVNASSGNTYLQSGRNDGETNVYNICLQPLAGKVAIGRKDARYLLDVSGLIAARYIAFYGTDMSTACGYVGRGAGSSNELYFESYNNGDIIIKPNGTGKVGVSNTSPSYSLDVSGTLNATTIYQNGVALGSRAFDSTAYLPLTGGTLTSSSSTVLTLSSSGSCSILKFYHGTTFTGAIESYPDTYGYGMVFFDVTYTKYVNLDKDGIFKYQNQYPFYHSNNSNKTDVPWSAQSLTLAGAITGCTGLTSSGSCIISTSAANSRDFGIINSAGGVYFGQSSDGSGYALTNASTAFSIYTNNTRRLYVAADGKVGIGTDSPSVALSVNGEITARGIADYHSNTGYWVGYAGYGLGSGTGTLVFTYGNNPTLFYNNGGEKVRITGTGDVGIGTSSPINKLDVSATSGVRFRCGAYVSSNKPSLGAMNTGTFGIVTNYTVGDDYGMYLWTNASSGSSFIQSGRNDGDTTAYNICLQPLGGRVGVGTTSPSYLFSVYGGALSVSNSSGKQILLETYSGTDMGLTFYSGGFLTGYITASTLILNVNGGKVGIGMTPTTNALEVSGVAYATTGIYSDGYVTAGTAASSSDIRLKENIASVTRERAKEVIMALNPCEWTWNDKHYKHGQRGAGMVAQEVESILPFAILQPQEYKYLEYDDFHAYEIKMLQSHETELEKTNRRLNEAEREIVELKRENAELKARLNA